LVRVLPIHFGVVLGCKGGGVKKKKAPETRQYRQDKPRQANTSQGQPPRSDDLQ